MATYSDIFIDQGSTFSSVIDVPDTNGLPFNLSSYTARGQIRKTYTSKNVVTFTTSIDLPLEGKVNISLTAGQTRAMKAGRYLYDIEIFNSTGHIFRIREGQVEISPGISDDNGGIELIPQPSLYEIIDERIDTRTIVTDKLLPLSATEEANFYANSKLDENLTLKAPLDSPIFTGIPIAPTANSDTNNQQIATTQFVRTAINNLIDGAPNVLDTLNELADAIGNDANFSTTIINGLSGKAPLNSPSFTGTVNGITKAMVGLGDVDNTSDLDKPVSTATQTVFNAKVDKVSGQGLSDENYTLIEKNKLVGIADGATANSTDAHLLSRANHTGSQSYTTITGLGTLATQSGTFSGSSSGTNTGDQTITLGGDATGSGTALLNVTLASTGVLAGEYNSSATSVTPFTVDIKGRITAVDTPITITPSWNSVTDKPTTVSGYSITDAVDLTSAQTISGVKDFTSSPTVPLIPTAAGHAASKAYVDTLSEGLHVHASVHALLQTPLASAIGGGVTITYSNGTNGVGAKLTASAPVTWTTVFNDSDIIVGSRVIIAGQSTSAHNGIYVISSSTELIRADDFNTPTEMAGGDFVFVTHGTYADTGWVLSEPVTEVGATAVIFTQFSGAGAYEAGAGLSRDGTTFSVVGGTGIAVDGSVSLSTVGSPGTYRSVTVDAYGRITSGFNPTTLSGYGITDAASSSALSNHISDATVHLTSTQNTLLDGITVTSEKVNYLSDVTSNIQSQLDAKQPLDSDLTAIANISETTGILKKNAANSWSLDTTNDILNQSFTVKAVSQGTYSDGIVIPAGTRLEDIIKNMLQTIVPAVYTQPTLSFTTSTTVDQEFGANVSPTFNGTFTQNDAGALSSYRIVQGGSVVRTTSSVTPFTTTFQILANTAFYSEVDYATGPQKYDNMGAASGTPIPAGTRTSSTTTFLAKRRTFYAADTTTTAVTTSANVRALGQNVLGHSNGSTFTINIPVGSRRITIAYPATLRALTSISYVEAGNAGVLDTFTATTINVEGANGSTATSYRVYTYIAPIAFGSSATYNVTI